MRIMDRIWYLWHVVLGSLAYLLWPTPVRVRRYFAKGTRSSWAWAKDTGWREQQNSLAICNTFTAQGDDGEMFYTSVTIDMASASPHSLESVKSEKILYAAARLGSFLSPECRCRLGPHFKCSVHWTWSN